jgi:hypothetical protein
LLSIPVPDVCYKNEYSDQQENDAGKNQALFTVFGGDIITLCQHVHLNLQIRIYGKGSYFTVNPTIKNERQLEVNLPVVNIIVSPL